MNSSNNSIPLRHDRGTGVVSSSGGQGFGKPSASGNIVDRWLAQGFAPWYIKPYYDYVIPPNTTVEIPLYVLCQNLYLDPLSSSTIYRDFKFFSISDSVMRVYAGIDRINRYLMDSLRTRFWVQGDQYVYYQGALTRSGHALIQTGHWVAGSSNYIETDWGRFYGVDSLYLNPAIVNWGIWGVTDKADSNIMKNKINEWRAYAGLPPLAQDIIRQSFCPVYAILNAAGLRGVANGFYQSWYDPILDVNENSAEFSMEYELRQNYPNPFNDETVIEYHLFRPGEITLEIFDLLGRKIETFVRGYEDSGSHRVTWDANGYPSGMYLYRLHYRDGIIVRKCLHLK
jgi:hypothetical protein